MTRHTLSNGLVVLIQEDHAKKVSASQLWVMVGSADENDAERGISHLIEHMAFKGTARRGVGQIAKEVEALGGEINAHTSWDHTVFHIVAPSSETAHSLDIIFDAVLKPTIDPKELEREKQVVLEEILESDERPERKSSKLLFSTAYVANPYKYPVIGYKEIVEKFTRDDIVAFRKKWYVPDNMCLVVVGDVDTATVLREVEKLTADIQPAGFFRPPRTLEPVQKEIRSSLVLDKNARETRLNIAFHVPSGTSIDVNPLDLAADILGSRESSRLVKVLKKEKGLVNSITVYSLTPKEPGLMVLSATLDFANLEAVTRGIMEEITRLAKEPPTVEELNRAKVHIEAQHVFSLETVQGVAENIGSSAADMGDPNYEDKYLILNRAVTPEEVSEVMNFYMRPLKSTITILAPENGAKNFKMDSLLQIIRSFQPPATQVVSGNETRKEAETTSVQLSNGLKVIITPDDAIPLVSLKVAHLGGKRFETKGTKGIMNFVAEMLPKGAGDLNELEISRKIESLGGRVSGFSGYDSFGLSTTIFSRNVDEGLNLLSTIFRNPSFPEDKIERERQLISNMIRTEPDRPVAYAINRLNETLYKKHPYGFEKEGTLETVAKFTRQDLIDCYRKYATPGNTVISIVGDVDPNKTLKTVEKLFGNIPPCAFEPYKVPAELPIEAPRIRTIRIPRAKAHIAIGFKGVTLADEDRYPLEVLNNILSGQGGRLFLQLRDKESLAYSVASFVRCNLDPGIFGFYIACDESKADKALSGLLSEIEKVREAKISEKDVKNSITNLIGGHEIALQSTHSRADSYALNTLYGFGWNFEAQYVEKISKVKPEDVSRVAKKYLDPERRAEVIILPESD
ncbi:MAG: M16 family metallopeptidase [Desulfomonilaceae bacterium]